MFGKVSKEEKEALKKRMQQALEEGKFQAAKKPQSEEDEKSDTSSADEPPAKATNTAAPPPAGEGNNSHRGAVTVAEEVAEAEERKRDTHAQATETLKINIDSEFVEITNIRLFSFEELNLDLLTKCNVLSFRKNLIHELSPLPLHLARRIHELDLFDNKIRKLRDFFETALVPSEGDSDAPPTKVEGEELQKGEEATATRALVKQAVACPFSSLTKLDLSYNQIKTIAGLDSLGGTLKELYLVENKIKEIQGLDSLINLELLELGGNRIRQIGNGLRNLTMLKQLWLGKNKITSIDDSLHQLPRLELLSLQANRIIKINPGEFQENVNPNLRELYLSENGIEIIENLPVHSLKLLDFSFNPIKTVNEEVINAHNMPLLSEFWLTDAKISSWDEVKKFAVFSETLRTIYIERNPIEQDRRYRDKVYMILPFVTQIDSWPVVNKGNLEADRAIQRSNPTDLE